MTVLQELKIKLDSLGTLGAIRIGSFPTTPDAIGALYEYGGLRPEGRFGVTGVGYERPSIQITFRGIPEDYQGPRDKAELAFQFLGELTPGALVSGVNTIYLKLDLQQSPFPTQPQDINKRFHIGFNFYVMKEPS